MAHKIFYIDVFSENLGYGNPVAVIINADDLSDSDMQRIAAWTNLSETTFILKAKDKSADYRLRIFTPKSEMPFAGHPTIGSCFAAIKAGIINENKTRVIQECGVGLVPINIGNTIEFSLPKAKFNPLKASVQARLMNILGQEIKGNAAIVNVGPDWIIAELEDNEAVLQCRPELNVMKALEQELSVTGVTIFGKSNNDKSFIEVRSFAPSDGIEEDPVCGSGNGAVCTYMLENALIGNDINYVASQGAAIGRSGIINVRVDDKGNIFIGGQCTLGINGTIEI